MKHISMITYRDSK